MSKPYYFNKFRKKSNSNTSDNDSQLKQPTLSKFFSAKSTETSGHGGGHVKNLDAQNIQPRSDECVQPKVKSSWLWDYNYPKI